MFDLAKVFNYPHPAHFTFQLFACHERERSLRKHIWHDRLSSSCLHSLSACCPGMDYVTCWGIGLHVADYAWAYLFYLLLIRDLLNTSSPQYSHVFIINPHVYMLLKSYSNNYGYCHSSVLWIPQLASTGLCWPVVLGVHIHASTCMLYQSPICTTMWKKWKAVHQRHKWF